MAESPNQWAADAGGAPAEQELAEASRATRSPDAPPPTMVFWETTNACNLTCAHCRRGAPSDVPSAAELSTAEAASLITDIAACGVRVLVLSGGEPLLRGDILRLASHAARAGLQVALATNGTLLDRRTAETLRRSGVARVSVSIDAAEPTDHDRFRGQQGAYAAAVRGMRHLRSAGVPFQINFSVTRSTIEHLDGVRDLALELGACALHLFLLVPVGCGLQIVDEEQVSAEDYERVLRWVLRQQADERLEVRATCAPHIVRIAQETGQALSRTAGGGCLAGTGIAFVSHVGDVQACGYLPPAAGNVRQRRFADIWRDSDLLNELRDRDRLEGTCGACGFRRRCGGCRARAYGVTGDYLAAEPFCTYEPPGQARQSGKASER